MLSFAVLHTPLTHGIQNRNEGFSLFCQAVFHFRRDLRVFFPVDKTIRLQVLQRHTQCFIGDRPDEFFQFIEADNAKFHKELKK